MLSVPLLVIACALACACGSSEPSASAGETVLAQVTGALTVDGVPVRLVRCRPGHAVHVFVEVDTSQGTLRFGEGKLWWQGGERTCQKLDRSWGGGVRRDGSAYFRGTLAFRCDALVGDLKLDCGGVTPAEAAELLHNRAEATAGARPVAAPAAGSGAAPAAGSGAAPVAGTGAAPPPRPEAADPRPNP